MGGWRLPPANYENVGIERGEAGSRRVPSEERGMLADKRGHRA